MCTTAAQEDPVAGNVAEATPAPIPPRFWWLERILVGVVLLLVVLAGLRWGWGVLAHRRLQAEIDRIRAAGEPLLPRDFDMPSVPDEDNAALVLQRAAGLLKKSGLVLEPPFGFKADAAYWADVGKNIEANAKVFALVRKARSLPQADWGLRITSPVANTLLPDLRGQRQLAKTLCVLAMYSHRMGDDAAAVEALRDLLRLTARVEEHPGFIISHLVAIATSSLACESVREIVPDLAVSNRAPPGDAPNRPATPDQIDALIAVLLDVSALQQGQVRGFWGERASLLDWVQLVADGTASMSGQFAGAATGPVSVPERCLTFVLRPMLELDGVHILRRGDSLMEAARATSWPAAHAKLPPDPGSQLGLAQVTRRLSLTLTPVLDRAVLFHHRGIASRRMAATALAVRTYELDRGRRPAALVDLVPEYLPAVPVDPFSPDGRPIGYRPTDDPPVLYSISENGIDEDGAYKTRPGGGLDYEAKDIPFFLNGERP